MTQALLMVHETDPKEEIQEQVKPHLHGFQPLGAQIVVGIYRRPEKTKGGIYVSAKTREEDDYQGKVGLVLTLGPLAFHEDATHKWGKITPKVGDWVVFRIGDTLPFELGERRCRFIEDVDVKAIIQRPDSVL